MNTMDLGTTLEPSQQLTSLNDSEPSWVRWLARSAWVIVSGSVLLIFLYTFAELLKEFQGWTMTYAALCGVVVAVTLLVLVGYWWFTTPEPGIVETRRVWAWRWSTRWASVVMCVLSIASASIEAMDVRSEFETPLLWLEIACVVPGVVGMVACCGYLAGLLARGGSHMLSSQAWLVAALSAMGALIVVPGVVLLIQYPQLWETDTPLEAQLLEGMAAALSFCGGGLILMVAWGWWMVLLVLGSLQWQQIASLPRA